MASRRDATQRLGLKDGMLTTQHWEFTPATAFSILDALGSVRWAFILRAYGDEDALTQHENFFRAK
eukprot:10564725-Heterocapsa_arctica.AAC.1